MQPQKIQTSSPKYFWLCPC